MLDVDYCGCPDCDNYPIGFQEDREKLCPRIGLYPHMAQPNAALERRGLVFLHKSRKKRASSALVRLLIRFQNRKVLQCL